MNPERFTMNITTTEFVNTIFPPAELNGHTVCIAVAKEKGMLQRAWPFDPGPTASYFCVSTVETPTRQFVARTKSALREAWVIVFDDVGTKSVAPPVEPSYILQTSVKDGSANFQYGYMLEPFPVDTPEGESYFDACLIAAAEAGWNDPGCRNANRVVRLPGSVHATGFVSVVTAWHPERVWNLKDLMGQMGLDPVAVQKAPLDASSVQLKDVRDPVLEWLVESGLTTGHVNNDFVEIECPWSSAHTNDSTTAGYSPKGLGRVGAQFRCLHGHCAERTTKDFLGWVKSQDGPDIADVVATQAERDALTNALAKIEPPLARGRRLIAEAQSVDELRTLDIASILGLSPEDSLMLAEDMKSRSVVLKPKLAIADCRRLCVTNEQRANEKAREQQRINELTKDGEKLFFGCPGGRIGEIVDALADKLNFKVFSRAGKVVYLQTDPVTRATAAVVTSTGWMDYTVSQLAVFTNQDGAVIDAPIRIPSALANGAGTTLFKPLAGISPTPFLREDGTLCSEPGWDQATGIWLAPTVEVPELDTSPEGTKRALELILGMVADFPFVTPADRAVWLCDLLAGVLRASLPTCPGVIYTAPTAGTGKTLLSELVNMILQGHHTSSSLPTSEEEIRKQVTSALDTATPVLTFDNVEAGTAAKSDVFAQLLTADRYSDRKLGSTNRAEYRNRMRLQLTGNNITPGGDLARRFCVCRIDTELEVPGEREGFKIGDIKGYVRENRGALLAAALTLAMHKPSQHLNPLASFTEWSRRVRDVVADLGVGDAVQKVDLINHELQAIRDAFTAINETMKDTPFWTASALATKAKLDADLADALESAGVPESGKDSGKLGYWLRSNFQRTAAGLVLDQKQQVSSTKLAKRWTLRRAARG